MSTLRVLLVTLPVLFLQVASQESPCPESFQYRNENGNIFGVVFLKPGYVGKVITSIGFTIAAQLPSRYVGKLSLMDSRLASAGGYEGLHVSGIIYRVDFPVTTPLPILSFLKVNNEDLCQALRNSASTPIQPGSFRTSISLQHTLFLNDYPSEWYPPPPQPNDNFHSFTSNTSPPPVPTRPKEISKLSTTSTTTSPPRRAKDKHTKSTVAADHDYNDGEDDYDDDHEERGKPEGVAVSVNHDRKNVFKQKGKKIPKITEVKVNQTEADKPRVQKIHIHTTIEYVPADDN